MPIAALVSRRPALGISGLWCPPVQGGVAGRRAYGWLARDAAVVRRRPHARDRRSSSPGPRLRRPAHRAERDPAISPLPRARPGCAVGDRDERRVTGAHPRTSAQRCAAAATRRLRCLDAARSVGPRVRVVPATARARYVRFRKPPRPEQPRGTPVVRRSAARRASGAQRFGLVRLAGVEWQLALRYGDRAQRRAAHRGWHSALRLRVAPDAGLDIHDTGARLRLFRRWPWRRKPHAARVRGTRLVARRPSRAPTT